jgi:superoxide dismutase
MAEVNIFHRFAFPIPDHLPLQIGHINHSLFWKNLAPVGQGGGKLKDGKLKAALERDFGSFDAFKKQFNATTAGIQGSGWGWLGYNPKTKKLDIVTTANQDPLLSTCIRTPFSFPTILPFADRVFKPMILSLASTSGSMYVITLAFFLAGN